MKTLSGDGVQISYSGGIEARLEGFGALFGILAIIGLPAALYYGNTSGYRMVWAAAGISGLINGIGVWILFQGLANMIRLLKQQNNLPYSGKISAPKEEKTMPFTCPECGEGVLESATSCPECECEFANDTPEEEEE